MSNSRQSAVAAVEERDDEADACSRVDAGGPRRLSANANAATCESLASLTLPDATITTAQPVAAGAFEAAGRAGAAAETP